MSRIRILGLGLFVAVLGAGLAQAQDQTFSGTLDGNVPSKDYAIQLDVGESVMVTAEALNGDLDTFLTLTDPSGQVVAENDDRNRTTLDSALGFTASTGGTYLVTVARYEFSDTSGQYELNIRVGSDNNVLEPLDVLLRLQLSGPELTRDTEHFRIHYTLEGNDATTEAYVDEVAEWLEVVWQKEIVELGWPPPPIDGERGGDGRYDVYLTEVIGAGSGALGYASPEGSLMDNPNTPYVEGYATSSYLVIDNDFADYAEDDRDAISLMRATAAHEFHHAIQFGYDMDDVHQWYYEASATWMETMAADKDQDATGYVEYNFQYPEICFGTTTDAGDGQLQYGDWLFIESLVDEHGRDFPPKLWASIAEYEGFESLERTLERYRDSIPRALARYRIQNLVRDYDLAHLFEATVWLESTISGTGAWTYTGRGIQELGANYFAVSAAPGVYNATLTRDGGQLLLWAVAVRERSAYSFALGRGGNFTNQGYDYVYLMVFNPVYDEDVNNCTYYDYSIEIAPGTGALAPVERTWDAAFFEPLR